MTETLPVTVSAVYDLSTGRRISERVEQLDAGELTRRMLFEYNKFKYHELEDKLDKIRRSTK